jgi:hypothetical protein
LSIQAFMRYSRSILRLNYPNIAGNPQNLVSLRNFDLGLIMGSPTYTPQKQIAGSLRSCPGQGSL